MPPIIQCHGSWWLYGENPFYDKHTENGSMVWLSKTVSPSFLQPCFAKCLFSCSLVYLTAPLWSWWCLICMTCTLCLLWNTFSLKSLMVCSALFVSVGSMKKKCAETKPDTRFLKNLLEKNFKSRVGVLSLSNSWILYYQFQLKPTVEISLSDELCQDRRNL